MTDWTGTWSYGYNDNNRLTSATAPNPVPDQPAGGNYGYDWVGNRVHPPSDPNPMIYNKADQLTSWPGMHTYTYNGDGSLHQVKDSSGTNVLRSYTYTNDGLLNAATYNGRTLTNTWDAGKNRVSYTAGGTTHTFVYDATAGIPAVIQEDGVYYVREPDGALIIRSSSPSLRYYHFDSIASTRLLTDSTANVTDKYAYDSYGSLIMHNKYEGSIDQPYQYVGVLGYYTHFREPDFKLQQLGIRFYDAELGRFTSRDPQAVDYVADSIYADGNPIIGIDPDGRKCRPYYNGDRLKSCNIAKCLKNVPSIQRGLSRVGKDIYMCDGKKDDDTRGETKCPHWPYSKVKHCNIHFWEDMVYPNGGMGTLCADFIHELLHAAYWEYGDKKNDESAVQAAAVGFWRECQNPCGWRPATHAQITDPYRK